MGLTRERWCCTRDLVRRLDMDTCQTSIETDIEVSNIILSRSELRVVVVVVVVFTLKTVLTSIQYPSLSYSSRQRNEFPWSQANPK